MHNREKLLPKIFSSSYLLKLVRLRLQLDFTAKWIQMTWDFIACATFLAIGTTLQVLYLCLVGHVLYLHFRLGWKNKFIWVFLRCSLSSTKSEVQNKIEKCKGWKRKMSPQNLTILHSYILTQCVSLSGKRMSNDNIIYILYYH